MGDLDNVFLNMKGYFVSFIVIDNFFDNFRIVIEEFFGKFMECIVLMWNINFQFEGFVFLFLKWDMEEDVVCCVNDFVNVLGVLVWFND